ncbi:hypothetical protein [Flavobacterium davisii]|uniref:Uncharacterized protein n=1 Tax=Flavobacterium columnare TaxID=996 RepID=A0A8G0KS27_9FLAO|nr:hypothetical protein [Flavobacterium davisii]QYS89078.1 hypothetical protein JJC05_01155 [Flavobacterium davisii]
MAQYFIRVSRTYSTKNKIQKICLNELKELNFSLASDLPSAKKAIKTVFEQALESYSGRAKHPELKQFDKGDKGVTSFYIEDVIYIDIYPVLNEI